MTFRKRFRSFVIGILPVLTGFSITAVAQLGGLDMYPQLRQGTGSASSRIPSDVNIPSLTEQSRTGTGMFELPDGLQAELSDQYDILLDMPIDRNTYIVGPGDYLSVYLWGEIDQQYASRVTPEGEMLIPTVGAVRVCDMTLAEAGNRICETVNRYYTNLDVTVNLLRPRRFRVFVTGAVERPNMYEANSLTRVSDLFVDLDPDLFPSDEESAVEQQRRQLLMQQQQPPQIAETRFSELDYPGDFIEGMKAGLRIRDNGDARNGKKASSKRAIVIQRGDEQIAVDLLRFEKLGTIEANPYVTGGDRVFVPGYLGDMFVEGEVMFPGIYEYKPGDTVLDLVGFSGGLTAVADSTATLVRFAPGGRDQVTMAIDLHDALVTSPGRREYRLEESDRLYIRTKHDYKRISNVRVEGEVLFPGYYAITDNVTRVTDVIALAGGLTPEANLDGAQIVKDASRVPVNPEYQRLQQMMRDEMTEQEYEFYKVHARTVQNTVAIDFVKLFTNNDPSQNIVLEDGDTITIPANRELVNVVGAVEVPGYIRTEPGADYRYYIEKAGGCIWNAKERDIRIVKAKSGKHLKPGKNVMVESGDTILVPEKQIRSYWSWAQQYVQMAANIVTILLVVDTVSK